MHNKGLADATRRFRKEREETSLRVLRHCVGLLRTRFLVLGIEPSRIKGNRNRSGKAAILIFPLVLMLHGFSPTTPQRNLTFTIRHLKLTLIACFHRYDSITRVAY